ncbi:MAG: hypothetical protein LBO65_09895 [Spirochaetaceae bacterium]|jgi:hypothetical protein|nr:hypothetical protein [Spirochaetaceae bacterium]
MLLDTAVERKSPLLYSPGKPPLFLNDLELSLVQDAEALLDAENLPEAKIVKHRFDCLKSFGATITLFPSIRESQILMGYVRNEQQLIKALVGLAPSSHLLRIPARIQAVRSFLVTKFHSFSLLCKVLPQDSALYKAVRSVLFSTMFVIMIEDVYFSCLDEPSFPEEIKIRLADELISLWDSGAEPAMVCHFSALEDLWKVRNDSPPTFGTMDGTSELIRISMDMEEIWHDFLLNQAASDETRWALDEFLFGLSYEDLLSVRSRLKRFGITAVDFNEIRSYLGTTPSYTVPYDSDPRHIYDFYIERKEAALFRKHLKASGPCKTLEEIYLKYRMTL